MEILNFPRTEAVKIPRLGFGTYQITPGRDTEAAVLVALKEGYRHIDTAALYGNEQAVGAAVRKSGLPREDVFVTTKLWHSDHGFQKAQQAFDRSLRKLGLDYVDLYLVHSPGRPGNRTETWQAMEAILESGKARSIGVSNYGVRHLQQLLRTCKYRPAVNQIELHPYNQHRDIVEFCEEHKIALEAYAPLTRGYRIKDPQLAKVAKKYGQTPAQILIRWGLQKNYVVLPKSVKPDRIRENMQVTDFEIAPEDVAFLDSLDEGLVTDWDPTVEP
ncbi:aldo/keto reductase family protein [Klebsormidium nitens]|uniref:Aldo/keto reductase family protein n=1 Tax=Klebsormidium nitens TaxID=105231 RepID=A0A1Y1ICJ4_KLENI|nr:aldo/keto reductase family protein [Klebsormidium nitens]|eukprot:GAQ85798.1 aldo/keto reductase family protein [Klebsormidium nitens]